MCCKADTHTDRHRTQRQTFGAGNVRVWKRQDAMEEGTVGEGAVDDVMGADDAGAVGAADGEALEVDQGGMAGAVDLGWGVGAAGEADAQREKGYDCDGAVSVRRWLGHAGILAGWSRFGANSASGMV